MPDPPCAWPGPHALADALAHALYRMADAPPAGTLAAESVRHVADDLLHRLAEAWLVKRWAAQDEPQDTPPVHPLPLRWQALLDVRLTVAGMPLAASVPGLRLRAAATPAPRPLTPAATLAAFQKATAPLEAIVGHAELSLGDLAHLQPGDVLLLDTRLLDPLTLRIASGAVTLPIALGTGDGARAVQLLPTTPLNRTRMNPNPSHADHDATRPIELPRLDALASSDPPLLPQRLAAFAGVRATVTVVAGATSASIGELLSLKDGAVLTLDRAVDAPFDVVLDGAVLARGHLVAVGDHFGLRITEVCTRGQD